MTNLTSILNRTIVAVAAFTLFSAATQADANDVVSVRLTSGKSITAQVDARTGDDRLWLRFDTGSTVVRRAIAWQDVREIKQASRSISIESVKGFASTPTVHKRAKASTRRSAPLTDAQRALQLLAFTPRVGRR